MKITRSSPIERSARVIQVEGLFDVPPSERSERTWNVDLQLPDDWSVGAIVGPSGAGKTAMLRELFAEPKSYTWDPRLAVIDGFPADMEASEITGLLSSVGFSSPPSWLRPYHALSNGEQFRVGLARVLADDGIAVIDEFTSVVDRDVAKSASCAVAKAVRRAGKQLVVASCHYDVLDWLEPDWVYQPHLEQMYTGRSGRHKRPSIDLEILRVGREAWRLFAPHHYLSTELATSAKCWIALWEGRPVAFTGILAFPHPHLKGVWREHRTVCLPDFQGAGIGTAMSDAVASIVTGMGYRYWSHTIHPAFVQARVRSKNWSLQNRPKIKLTPRSATSLSGSRESFSKNMGVVARPVSRFEYIGAALPIEKAQELWLNP